MTLTYKKLLSTFIILSGLMLVLAGCSSNPKNFPCRDLTITLNENFTEKKMSGFDAYYVSEYVIFSAVEETEEDLQYAGYEITNLSGYCSEILNQNNVSSDKLKSRRDYYYFSNTSVKSGAKYTYVHCMFQGHNSYWICEFVCKTKDYDKYKDDIFKWADSISIK